MNDNNKPELITDDEDLKEMFQMLVTDYNNLAISIRDLADYLGISVVPVAVEEDLPN